MIAVIDSSVLLRKLFGGPESLAEWADITEAYASRILLLEVGRVIDKCRLGGQINDEEVDHLHQEARRAQRSIEILALSDAILKTAAGTMPTVLGSLDAIHLATALELWRHLGEAPTLATHDAQLGRAARASGIRVVGCG